MTKIKEKIVKFAKNLKKLPPFQSKRQRILILFSVLLLILATIYLLVVYRSDDQAKNSVQEKTKLEISTVTDLASSSDCENTTKILSDMDVDESKPEESAIMLNLRANCYVTLRQYDKAIADYEQAKSFWEKAKDKYRVEFTENAIKYVKKQKSNPPKEQKRDPRDELTQEFIDELNRGSSNE